MQLHDEINQFMQECKSIMISSLNLNNQTICSYTPIIKNKNDFYIYISEIAEHFEGVKYNNKNIEIMFIQDEKDCISIFARKRLKFRIESVEITRDNQLFEQVLNTYENKNNKEIIQVIKNMQDFHLFQLILKNGRYVKGFGKAYEINEGAINLINSKGHK
ncbi:hypothetical protein DSE64_08310 [Campylobacter lari]|nr:hypothetical protein [Campylobacter lari]